MKSKDVITLARKINPDFDDEYTELITAMKAVRKAISNLNIISENFKFDIKPNDLYADDILGVIYDAHNKQHCGFTSEEDVLENAYAMKTVYEAIIFDIQKKAYFKSCPDMYAYRFGNRTYPNISLSEDEIKEFFEYMETYHDISDKKLDPYRFVSKYEPCLQGIYDINAEISRIMGEDMISIPYRVENIITQTQKEINALDVFCREMIEDAGLAMKVFDAKLNACLPTSFNLNNVCKAVIAAYEKALTETVNDAVTAVDEVKDARVFFRYDSNDVKKSYLRIKYLPYVDDDKTRCVMPVIKDGKSLKLFINNLK